MTPSTILLAEDSEDDVILMRRAWQKASIDHSLAVVQDSRQALDYLSGLNNYADRTVYPFPSMVLLDLKMPFLDGFDVLSWIRQQDTMRYLVIII